MRALNRMIWYARGLFLIFLFACSDSDSANVLNITDGIQTNNYNMQVTTPSGLISKDEQIIPPQYIFNRYDFIKRYNDALKRLSYGEHPTGGYAADINIIPIDKRVYGIDKIAVLPLKERALTDMEMLRLAEDMDGMTADDILKAAYTEYNFSNRELTYDEFLRFRKTESAYLYENLRPEQVFDNSHNNGDPFYVDLEYSIPDTVNYDNSSVHTGRYWLYPLHDITDEQFLLLIDDYFKQHDSKPFIPLPVQIQAKEVNEIALALADKYQMNNKRVISIYYYYVSYRNVASNMLTNKEPDTWTVELNYGMCDYIRLKFSAEDGSLIWWSHHYLPLCLLSINSYQYETLEKEIQVTTNDIPRAEEEITNAATDYAERILLCEALEMKAYFSGNWRHSIYGVISNVNIECSDGSKYQIQVMSKDLSVFTFEKKS